MTWFQILIYSHAFTTLEKMCWLKWQTKIPIKEVPDHIQQPSNKVLRQYMSFGSNVKRLRQNVFFMVWHILPTINNLVQRYFGIFTWHSKKNLVIGWGGFNSLFDYPGLHIFIQTCHLTYCEMNYKKEQKSSKR